MKHLGAVRNTAFTLVELMVAVAIVSVLAALLLPAVQSIRESARRNQCASHLKQIGLALHCYHDAHRTLPPGTISPFASARTAFDVLFAKRGAFDPANTSAETPWLFQLWPFLEQRPAWDQFDVNVGVFGYVNLRTPYMLTGLNANAALMQAGMPVVKCPSDFQRPFNYDVNALLDTPMGIPVASCSRANYAANWGNTTWEQNADLDGDGFDDTGVQFLRAPFGRSRSVRFSEIQDGLGQTVVVAEVIQGQGIDGRGACVVPLPGASVYMSRFPPNGTRDVHGFLPSIGAGSGDQMPFPATCRSESGLPCTYDSKHFTACAASRSRHSGGVQVLLGGGSVQFVSNLVSQPVWSALHSIQADDVSGGEF